MDAKAFPGSSLPAYLSAGAVAATGAIVIPLTGAGPLTEQMVQHLALMNVAAPLLASRLALRNSFAHGGWLVGLGALQIAMLWAWHAPGAQTLVAGSIAGQALSLAALGVASALFWTAALRAAERKPWRAIAALLLTGKLACLLGGLMIFSSRDLYRLEGLAFAICASGPSTLEDQQVAGLMMITACPLSYLVAGVAIAAQMLSNIGKGERSADAIA